MEQAIDDKIDQFEAIMLSGNPIVECPLKHLFLPGMYIRIILMPQDSWITSMIHNTVHPFFIKQGRVSVYSELMEEQMFEAGDWGITTPGTRRILFIHEETEWLTMHPLPFITGLENSLSKEEQAEVVRGIEGLILEKHINPLLGGYVKNNIISPSIETK